MDSRVQEERKKSNPEYVKICRENPIDDMT
jgi:hypothetical protein